MDRQRVDEAADLLWASWRSDHRLESIPDHCRPRSVDEGYAVQDALASRHGDDVIGWKIAATSAAGQRHIGVSEPLGGRLFGMFCHRDGARLPAAGLHMRVAEAEFAFRMAVDLPPRGRDYGMDEVMAAVDTLHLAIEVPDSRFRDFAHAGAAQLAADDACASLFVLGAEATGWRDVDLAGHPVVGRLNGAVAGEGSGANVLGDPRIALTWLANDRAHRGGGLEAGHLVTTGTCIKPVTIGAGDAFIADFGPLGRVSVAFV